MVSDQLELSDIQEFSRHILDQEIELKKISKDAQLLIIKFSSIVTSQDVEDCMGPIQKALQSSTEKDTPYLFILNGVDIQEMTTKNIVDFIKALPQKYFDLVPEEILNEKGWTKLPSLKSLLLERKTPKKETPIQEQLDLPFNQFYSSDSQLSTPESSSGS